jgi:predicted phage terminase large subunit-like protein
MDIKKIAPQSGKQTQFLSSKADIVLYGGAAGGGKSYALLLEALRNIHVQGFGAVIFRRTSPQIRAEGGLWDTSATLYPQFGFRSRETQWIYTNGNKISFSHMEYEKDRFNWQGSQIPLIGFDELTHFTKTQFFYLLSRNRSVCGVKPYMRATTNPDPNSWVRDFIDWWIDKEGFAIPERSGVMRYFVNIADEIRWSDSPERLKEKYGVEAKSFTFIPAKLDDNKILMDSDPGYKASLLALPRIERERLLGGNWNISEAGGIFQIDWFQRYKDLPQGGYYAQSWDTAVKDKQHNDYTVCTTWYVVNNTYYLAHMLQDKLQYPQLKSAMLKLANDFNPRKILIEDKASGQSILQDLRQSSRLPIVAIMPKTDKLTRANLASRHVEAGRVYIPYSSSWLTEFERQVFSFPSENKEDHDDIVDSLTQFINYVNKPDAPRIRQL